EELVDQKKYLEEACKPKCVKPFLQYQDWQIAYVAWIKLVSLSEKPRPSRSDVNPPTSCVKRIKDDETGHKHCTGQYFDYWSCVDHCVAPRLFEKLKTNPSREFLSFRLILILYGFQEQLELYNGTHFQAHD
ncbi:Ubiquinol-cytochrome C reductase hinge domain, partial [Dillenia turbinata]